MLRQVLSKIFLRGYHGIEKDIRKASAFLEAAAKLGNSEAQKFYSMILMASEGVENRANLGVPSRKVTDINVERTYSQHLKHLRKLAGKM